MPAIKIEKKYMVAVVGIVWSCFHLYTGLFGLLAPLQQRPIHVMFALIITFLLKPYSKKIDCAGKLYLDQIILIVMTLFMGIYITWNAMALNLNTGNYSSTEFLVAVVTFIVVLEGARRLTGWALILIGLFFCAYTYFGPYMPALLSHPGQSVEKIITFQTLSNEGIFGTAAEVSSAFIFLFILYAQFLYKTGGGQAFIDLATSVVGTVRGGPAKVAVVASCLFGSISGSAVANVAGTGTFTIPLMKKIGYPSHFAGAVEAVASSGGQFMPPIMGASAFLIAEIVGLPYLQVALFALVPAVLYYLAIFFMVDFEAGKEGICGIPRAELPRTSTVLKESWPAFLSPITLVFLLAVLQQSPAKSVVIALGVTIVTSYFSKKTRLTPRKILEALEEGAVAAIETAVVCAAVGVVVGAITQSGLALKLSTILVVMAGGSILILLLLTMFSSILFGMGLPTVACYLILAVMVAPALTQMGILPIAAHLFIFYFGIISNITPPVALASFVASGIADAPFMKTGFTALKLGISAFILPFMFVYNPGLILQGDMWNIIQCVLTATVGIFSLSIALEGYFLCRVPLWQRIAFGIAAITLIVPEIYTDIAGVVIFAVMVVIHIGYRKKEKKIELAVLENETES